MILPHAQQVHAFASYRLTASEMDPALGVLLMLLCATAARAKDGGKEEQMTQVSISSAFDSPQVLQECLSYLRQTAQDQVADRIVSRIPNHHQLRYTIQKLTLAFPVAELLSGLHSGRQSHCGLPQGGSHFQPP